MKEKLMDINNNKDWETKLKLLLSKIKDTSNNAEIINKISKNNPGILIVTSGKFFSDAKAKETLQTWCKQDNKNDQKLVEELCKVKKKFDWMS